MNTRQPIHMPYNNNHLNDRICLDYDTGEELQGHTDSVTSVSFSPDGNQIVSNLLDESVRVWNAKTGEQLLELQGHSNWVESVSFSPDGNHIVSGSHDASVRVWTVPTDVTYSPGDAEQGRVIAYRDEQEREREREKEREEKRLRWILRKQLALLKDVITRDVFFTKNLHSLLLAVLLFALFLELLGWFIVIGLFTSVLIYLLLIIHPTSMSRI